MNPDCRLNIGVFDACVAADVPVFLWGPPGSGKSSAVRCWAGERGYALTELTPSVLDPTDLLGLPYQREDGRGGFDTWYAPPDWLSGILAAPDKKHLVFLDGLNLAARSVTHACLRLVLNRAVHTLQLPDGVRFAAAGIDPSQAPTAQELPAPMADRFAHIEWKGLRAGAALAGWPLPPPPPRSDKDWMPIAGAFLDARPMFNDDCETGDGPAAAEGRGFPSSRA